MVRFLPVVVLVILVLFVGGFLWIRNSQIQPTSQTTQLKQISGQVTTKEDTFAPVSNEDRLKILEDAVVALAKKVNGEMAATDSNTALVARVSSLEDKVTVLQRLVSQLQSGTANSTTTQTTTTTKQSPIYIPLGWVATSTSMDWATISSQSITIDTSDYPGMISAQFEARIGNYQGNGTAYARLINTADGTAILASQVSANGTDYTWVSSSTFSLPQGKKTYAVQLKSNTGYAAQIADAHLKINF